MNKRKYTKKQILKGVACGLGLALAFFLIVGSFILGVSATDCSHQWSGGMCMNCGEGAPSHTCEYVNGTCKYYNCFCYHYDIANGVCPVCGFECSHISGFNEGICKDYGCPCPHSSYTGGTCDACGMSCAHLSVKLIYTIDKPSNYKHLITVVCRSCGLDVITDSRYNTTEDCRFTRGICDYCGRICLHPSYNNSNCSVCGLSCTHSWSDGYNRSCSICGKTCDYTTHSYVNGICKTCGYTCPHTTYNGGKCERCGKICTHSWSDGYNRSCSICGLTCDYTTHSYVNGTCKTCGYTCPHTTYDGGQCERCGKICTHSWSVGYKRTCNTSGLICDKSTHTFVDGACTRCGALTCKHVFSIGKCIYCDYVCEHEYKNSAVCVHCFYSNISPTEDDDNLAFELISSIYNAQANIFLSMLNYNVFGVNIAMLVGGVIVFIVSLWVFKKVK